MVEICAVLLATELSILGQLEGMSEVDASIMN